MRRASCGHKTHVACGVLSAYRKAVQVHMCMCTHACARRIDTRIVHRELGACASKVELRQTAVCGTCACALYEFWSTARTCRHTVSVCTDLQTVPTTDWRLD